MFKNNKYSNNNKKNNNNKTFHNNKHNNNNNKDVYSKVIRSGNRTYFFDVKKNRVNELYITITESKKQHSSNHAVNYKKYKLHLYKEDFSKFKDYLMEVLDFINKESQKK